MLQAVLKDKLPEITILFKQNRVKRAYAFGSVCRDDFNEASDIDLLIAFEDGLDPIEYGDYYWALDEALPRLLERPVDLVTERSLRNRFLIENINATKVAIYAV
jgi:hypothetical protein